jgi:hypothetical protein
MLYGIESLRGGATGFFSPRSHAFLDEPLYHGHLDLFGVQLVFLPGPICTGYAQTRHLETVSETTITRAAALTSGIVQDFVGKRLNRTSRNQEAVSHCVVRLCLVPQTLEHRKEMRRVGSHGTLLEPSLYGREGRERSR